MRKCIRFQAGALCLLAAFFLSGCATLCNHRRQFRIPVETAVPGAAVRVLNRGELVAEGTTPFEVDIESSPGHFVPSKYEFQFKGEGFSPTTVYREGYVSGSYWINLIFLYTAPIGMLFVDPWTGAMYEIDGGQVFAGPRLVAEKPKTPKCRVVSMDRVAGESVMYDFKLSLVDDFAISEVKSIQDELAELVRSAYVGSDQAISRQDVRVGFPDFRIADGSATGRAVVVAVTVVRMNYDNDTHKGFVRVRYPTAQYAVARKWVRDHIETLARDKNIALVTGEIPPSARFFLGAERVLEGNILEVEFETE